MEDPFLFIAYENIFFQPGIARIQREVPTIAISAQIPMVTVQPAASEITAIP